jgi:hypothetical protein
VESYVESFYIDPLIFDAFSGFGIFSCESFILFCFVVGIVKIWGIISILIGTSLSKKKDLKKVYGGGWALITGGSEGIGEAIAI